jgi:hypothetical protein
MTEQEAWQILGIPEQLTWEETVKVCDIVLPVNIPPQ